MVVIAICIVIMAAALAGVMVVTGNSAPKYDDKERIVVVSPHPVDFMRPLINEFESESGIRVEIIKSGTSAAIDMIENGDQVDVLWGGSILNVGPYGESFLPYKTVNYDRFSPEFKNVGDAVTCFTDVPSVIMINTDLVGEGEILGYKDLLKPEFKGKIAFADPAKSSSSFEQLTNMLYAMGNGNPENGWDYVSSFAKQLNGELLSSSSEVYQGVAQGKYLVGLTFEEAAITMLKAGYHVKMIYMQEGVVFTPDGIYISKNASNQGAAKAFVDFMTSFEAQQYISKDLGRRSVRSDVESSKLVTSKESIKLIKVDRDLVVESGKEWTARFKEVYGEDRDE